MSGDNAEPDDGMHVVEADDSVVIAMNGDDAVDEGTTEAGAEEASETGASSAFAELAKAADARLEERLAEKTPGGLDRLNAARSEQQDKPDDSRPSATGGKATGAEETDETSAATETGAATAEPGSAAGEDELWGNASENQRAAFEEQRSRAARAEHELRSMAGRLAALEGRSSDVGTGETGAGRERPAAGDGSAEDRRARVARGRAFISRRLSGEQVNKIKQMGEEWPDLASPLDDVFDSIGDELAEQRRIVESLRDEMGEVGADRFSASVQAAEQEVATRHPDYRDIVDSSFYSWLDAQPEPIQQMYAVNHEDFVDAATANRLLDFYKLDTGRGQQQQRGGNSGNGTRRTRPRQQQDVVRAAQKQSATGLPNPSNGATAEAPAPAETPTKSELWAQREAAFQARRAS